MNLISLTPKFTCNFSNHLLVNQEIPTLNSCGCTVASNTNRYNKLTLVKGRREGEGGGRRDKQRLRVVRRAFVGSTVLPFSKYPGGTERWRTRNQQSHQQHSPYFLHILILLPLVLLSSSSQISQCFTSMSTQQLKECIFPIQKNTLTVLLSFSSAPQGRESDCTDGEADHEM